jgi:hypothetical protein
MSSFLLSYEFSNVITSRSINIHQIPLFFASLALLLLNLSEQFDKFSLSIASYTVLGIASLTDLSVLILLPYELIMIYKSKRYHRMMRAVYLFVFEMLFLAVDSAIQFWIERHTPLELFGNVPKSSWYVFPLWKFQPRIIWTGLMAKIYLFSNPVTVLLSTLFSGFGFWRLDGLFYFLTIFWIWFLKNNPVCEDFQLALLFGVSAIANLLAKAPLSNFFGLLVGIAVVGLFAVCSPWVYALPILDDSHNEMNI